MIEFENNAFFWQKLDTLYYSSSLKIERCKGSCHPIYKNLIYPVDYGYLIDTISNHEHGIAVFKGSDTSESVNTMIVSADILKRDIECKLLVSCTENEVRSILEFLNQTDFQKSIIVYRSQHTPDWGYSD